MKGSNMKNTYIQPYIPEFGYSFVAASAQSKDFGGYAVYLKHTPGPKNKITVKERTATYIWFVCPDREILIVRNNYHTEAFYPYGDSFDTCVNFNLINDQVSKGLNIEYIMTNYVHDSNSKSNRLISTLSPEDRIQMLSDSGGLQLARGVKGIIHPRELVEYYNDNVDAGMILDLPLFFSDTKIAKRAAKLQRLNNNIMLKYSKGPELINIFHGQTEEERAMFRSIVEDKKIPRVAIGGMYRYLPTAAVNAIYDTIEGPFRYKQYHVLGIFTTPLVPLMVKLANSSVKAHITSDSTSHIQSAINKAYHFQFDIYHNMKRIPIGSRGAAQNTLRYLPCQCKVCTTIKYADILGFGDSRFTSELLAMHNASEMSRYASSLQEICLNSSPREYNRIVEEQLKRGSELSEVKAGLDFIDCVDKHGLAAAKKKYKFYINKRRLIVEQTPKPLFGDHELNVDNFKENVLKRLHLMEQNIKE
jgi:hypothetical protein